MCASAASGSLSSSGSPTHTAPGRSSGSEATSTLELIDVLFLCTGNICRSPVAEALLRHRFAKAGIDATVRSAGILESGHAASAHGVDVLSERGIDMTGHRSQTMSAGLLGEADLILGMAREHVREAVVTSPPLFGRTFTLRELVRRGTDVGPRPADQPLDEWLAQVHAGRTAAGLMGRSTDDDVADPIGQPRPAYERMVAELEQLIDDLFRLVWGDQEREAVR